MGTQLVGNKKEEKIPDWVAAMCNKMIERTEEIIKRKIKGVEGIMELRSLEA